jgi:hypothetical protein
MPTNIEDVRLSKTGSERRAVKVTRLTHCGHRDPQKDGGCNGISSHPSASKRLANYSSAMILSPRLTLGVKRSPFNGTIRRLRMEEAKMKLLIALSVLLITGFVAASPKQARAVVYCQYVEYPAGCVVRPGVVVAPTHDVRKIPPPINAPTSGFIILRQDLFDRNNPNNLRSDWHSPPAQPGQF